MAYDVKYKRFWEIDFLRGLAVIMMIVFHLIFDLNYFNITNIFLDQGGWLIFHWVIQFLFIGLAGTSVVLYSCKHKDGAYKKIIRRGFTIFLYGMLITLATFIFFREQTVVFGILHLIGLSIILSALFYRFTYTNLVLGIIIFMSKSFIENIVVPFPWLVWLGFKFPAFYTLDYYPLLPWFGLVLIGLFIGNFFYKNRKRHKVLNFLSKEPPVIIKQACFLGRYSLEIYLIHLPILFGLVWLISVL